MEYKVVPIERDHQRRFGIADENGEIVDDAQGWGYKTAQNAQKVIWYKFKGGREKLTARKAAARTFWRAHPEAKKLAIQWLEASAKELATGEYTLRDLVNGLREELGLEVKEEFLKELDDDEEDEMGDVEDWVAKNSLPTEAEAQAAKRNARQAMVDARACPLCRESVPEQPTPRFEHWQRAHADVAEVTVGPAAWLLCDDDFDQFLAPDLRKALNNTQARYWRLTTLAQRARVRQAQPEDKL